MTLEDLELMQPQDFVKLGYKMERYKYMFEQELTNLNHKTITQDEFMHETKHLVAILDNIELCNKVLIILFQKKRTNVTFEKQDLLSYQEILDNIDFFEMQKENKKIEFGTLEEMQFLIWFDKNKEVLM